ncbi:MAG: beta-lactamase family protein [Bdellovibrio sp.]|nr:beta-lactamase family protein [Bdellovibrio sp.]
MKVLLIMSLLFLGLKVYAGPFITLKTQTELDYYLERSGFNGVILVAKGKQVLSKKAYGVTNFIDGRPLTTSDKFQIGSLTKQFIAASLLRLQEEGKLSLDDQVTKYLPMLSNFNNIKIRNLLNHSSGIANYTDQEKFWAMVEYSRVLTLDEILDFIIPLPLDFEPRTNWKYSNSGYIVAGKILELVSQQSWNEYVHDNFLEPLEMKNSGVENYFEKVSDVIGHMLQNGKLAPFTAFNLSWGQSAGALYSTVDDLLKWSSIYTDSDLLSKVSKNEMQTPFLQNYALGVLVQNYKNEKMITHSGRTPGFVSYLTCLNQSKICVITLDNIDGNTPAKDILLSFYRENKAEVVKLDDYPMNEMQLMDFVGNYQTDGLKLKIYLENGVLYLLPDGQRAYKLRPNDIDSFELEKLAAEEFIRDSNGKVTGFIHYQGGRTSMFNRSTQENEKSFRKSGITSNKKNFLDEFDSREPF